VLQSLRLAPDAEIPKEIEDVIALNGGVETVEDISLLRAPLFSRQVPHRPAHSPLNFQRTTEFW
jgi:hypothetical protein